MSRGRPGCSTRRYLGSYGVRRDSSITHTPTGRPRSAPRWTPASASLLHESLLVLHLPGVRAQQLYACFLDPDLRARLSAASLRLGCTSSSSLLLAIVNHHFSLHPRPTSPPALSQGKLVPALPPWVRYFHRGWLRALPFIIPTHVVCPDVPLAYTSRVYN